VVLEVGAVVGHYICCCEALELREEGLGLAVVLSCHCALHLLLELIQGIT
jgi:hypothetical protein